MSQRPRRQSQIIELIRSQSIASQDELRDLLNGLGLCVTQATLSRDLRALGVVKGPSGYTLAGDGNPDAQGEELARCMGMFAYSVVPADSLVIVRTGPGHAQIVALALDHASLPHALGTIAGDDTIFIATPGRTKAVELTRVLRHIAGLDT